MTNVVRLHNRNRGVFSDDKMCAHAHTYVTLSLLGSDLLLCLFPIKDRKSFKLIKPRQA